MTDKQFHRISPRIHGACGRLVVVEHGGILLEHYLNQSFAERAEYALQLLGLVNMLWVRLRSEGLNMFPRLRCL